MYLERANAELTKPMIIPPPSAPPRIIIQFVSKKGIAYLFKDVAKPSDEKELSINFGTRVFNIAATKPKLSRAENTPYIEASNKNGPLI